jgi:NTP pyrophosphatase (non-canonical NTP hydrolase)
MMYCIYHIPGKKIGVTNDIQNRVVRQQGYSEDEFEILEMSEDIGYISNLEVKLQKKYGYKVDRQLYKDLKPNKTNLNHMNINITEQTTTFPCPVNKLKGRLMDEMAMGWSTEHGNFCITVDSIGWIMKNIRPSMYNGDRCYVYNKAFAAYFEKVERDAQQEEAYDRNRFRNYSPAQEKAVHSHQKSWTGEDVTMFHKIREWAKTRGIYDRGDTKTQYIKLMEEAGELSRAILKEDKAEFIDAIGDMVVVLTNLAALGGVDIEDCMESAYKVISARKGAMVNGTFVKSTL